MARRIWVPALMVLAFFFGTAGTRAQTVGPGEAVKPDGAVGAPVPQSAVFAELPNAEAGNDLAAAFLKYALLEDDVVVVDTVRMRVVDIIHGAARP